MLFVGSNDVLVTPLDFEMTKAALPDSAMLHFIDDYNHLDYMWAVDANELINKDVFSFFDKYGIWISHHFSWHLNIYQHPFIITSITNIYSLVYS